jgi:DNA gyrase inhibitor GyrI
MVNTYVTLPAERVLYLHKVGDYNVIGPKAEDEMKTFLASVGKLVGTKVFSMSYDNPEEKPLNCRFEFCAVVSGIAPQGEIKEKTLDGGRFVVFRHQGPDHKLGAFILDIFAQWHTTNPNDAICGTLRVQHKDLYNQSIPEEQRETDIFVPVDQVV